MLKKTTASGSADNPTNWPLVGLLVYYFGIIDFASNLLGSKRGDGRDEGLSLPADGKQIILRSNEHHTF